MARALDKNQAKSLLRHDDRRGSVKASGWLKSGDRKLLYEAAISHKKTVVFNDGKKYAISYAIHQSIAWGEHEAVFVKPADDRMVPCGWFRVKALLAGGTNG